MAHNDIGYCLFKMNKFNEAQEYFKQAIRCDGNHQASYDNYIHTLAHHDEAEGLRYLG
jgi:Tfp pilus assembly protein PilF